MRHFERTETHSPGCEKACWATPKNYLHRLIQEPEARSTQRHQSECHDADRRDTTPGFPGPAVTCLPAAAEPGLPNTQQEQSRRST